MYKLYALQNSIMMYMYGNNELRVMNEQNNRNIRPKRRVLTLLIHIIPP